MAVHWVLWQPGTDTTQIFVGTNSAIAGDGNGAWFALDNWRGLQ